MTAESLHLPLIAAVLASLLGAAACGDDTGGGTGGSGGSTTSSAGGEDGGQGGDDGGGGGSSGFGDIGDRCEAITECDVACLKEPGDDVGYCSVTCLDGSECPEGTTCDAVDNASATYCVLPPEEQDSTVECQDGCDEYDFFECMSGTLAACRDACVAATEADRQTFLACVANDLECTDGCDSTLGG